MNTGSSTETFAMIPIHQTTTDTYKGTRDDYIFEFVYSTTVPAADDITNVKIIALILPSAPVADYVILGSDCQEAPSSEIQILECWT